MISEVAFGHETCQIEKVNNYVKSPQLVHDLEAIGSLWVQQVLFPFPYWMWKWSPYYHLYEKPAAVAADRIGAICSDIIKNKRVNKSGKGAESSLLDVLLRQDPSEVGLSDKSEGVTDEELLATVKTFFIAGSDTTSIVSNICNFMTSISIIINMTTIIFELLLPSSIRLIREQLAIIVIMIPIKLKLS